MNVELNLDKVNFRVRIFQPNTSQWYFFLSMEDGALRFQITPKQFTSMLSIMKVSLDDDYEYEPSELIVHTDSNDQKYFDSPDDVEIGPNRRYDISFDGAHGGKFGMEIWGAQIRIYTDAGRMRLQMTKKQIETLYTLLNTVYEKYKELL